MSGIKKNVAGQKWRVFAFDKTNNNAQTGDAANITAKIAIDNGTANATNDVNPTEVEDGYYVFDLTQAESNGDVLDFYPESSTSNIAVIGVPGRIFTVSQYFSVMGIESDGHVHGDLKEWLGAAPAALADTDKVQTSVQHMANNVITAARIATDAITAAKIAADAIGASELATDAVNEIRDSILSDSTAFAGANIDATVSSRAAAAVVGALADAAAAGDPTASDTIMQYIKQIVNVLIGTTGVTTFPAEAAPANNVSLSEVIRAIHTDVTGLNGDAMRGTDNAALASVATEARLAELDAANIPSDVDSILTDTADMQPKLGTPAGADMSADIAAVKAETNSLDGTKITTARANNLDEITSTRLAELDAANIPADIDSLIAEIVTAQGEPAQGAPPVSANMADKIAYIYKAWRNRSNQTATTYQLYADDATTVDHKATVSDDGTTAEKGEVATGP